jgi:hypothetical protein
VNVELLAFDILDSKYYKECADALNTLGLEFTIFPVLFVGNNAYLGNSALEAGLIDELNYFNNNKNFRPFNKTLSTSAGNFNYRYFIYLFHFFVLSSSWPGLIKYHENGC